MMGNYKAVITRDKTEDMDHNEWTYDSRDFNGIYGRVYLITGDKKLSVLAAGWSRLAVNGYEYPFPGGKINVKRYE